MGEQLTLETERNGAHEVPQDPATVAHARASDPPTSHEAARSVDVTRGQRLVVDLIVRHYGTTGDFTLEDLVARAVTDGLAISPSGVRTRCKELVVKEWVVRRGTTTLPSGRSAQLHRLVHTGHNEPRPVGELTERWKNGTQSHLPEQTETEGR